MRVADLQEMTSEDWETIVAGEHEPFGRPGGDLRWQRKTRHVGIREEHGLLVASAGLVAVKVSVADGPPFEVQGIGGVIVTRSLRGQGLARLLIERLLEIAAGQGAGRAMLFCLPDRAGLYAKFGFREIAAPVRARQPDGSVEMPIPAMWRPLRPGVGWPDGPVEVLGEPF